MKKIIALFLSILIIAAPPLFAAELIYEYNTSEELRAGLTHTHIRRFQTDGWLDIHMVRADLSQPNLSLELLRDPRGTSYLSTVQKLAEQTNALAAVNADFFQWKSGQSGRGSSIGPQVRSGVLQSTPAHEAGMAAGTLTWDNKLSFGYYDYSVTVTAPDGKSCPVKHINKYDPLDSMIMITPEWDGGKSLGAEGSAVEMIVADGIVRELRRNSPPVDLPANGYSLVVLTDYNTFLIDHFSVGDAVSLDISINPSLENAKMLVGAGAILVENGQKPAKFSHNAAGKHPRSALGVDASGRIIYMVTVDGRQRSSMGMTQDELAHFLIERGVYNAVNFDGGGSTTMVVDNYWTGEPEVVNSVSDGSQRAISNAVGILNAASDNELHGLKITSDGADIFRGGSRRLWVVGHDRYKNPFEIDYDKINWSVSGIEGHFQGNAFYPAQAGRGIVRAELDGATGEYAVNVLAAPLSISVEPRRIDASQPMRITGLSPDGITAPIRPTDVQINAQGAYLEENGILSGGGGVMGFTFEGVTAYAQLDDGAAADYEFESQNGHFQPYPDYVGGGYAVSAEQAKSGAHSGKLTFDFTAQSTESRAAHMVLSQPVTAPSGVKDFSLWVYAPTYYDCMLRAQFTDGNGETARLELSGSIGWTGWKHVSASIPDDFARPLTLTKLYVVQTAGQAGESGSVYFDDLTIGAGAESGSLQLPEDITRPDILERPSELAEGGTRFLVFGIRTPSTFAEKVVAERAVKIAESQGGFPVFVGSDSGFSHDAIITRGYDTFIRGDSTFVYADSSNDGFMNTDSRQWMWLRAAILDTSTPNFFMFMPRDLAFSDANEGLVLKDMLEEIAKQGKTVMAFYYGSAMDSVVENGVRYMSIPSLNIGNGLANDLKHHKYVSVTANAYDVSYEIKSMLQP